MNLKDHICSIVLFSIISILNLSCHDDKPKIDGPLRVKVINSDYSMAYSTIYELSKDSIRITFSGHLQGEADTVIYRKPLSTEEKREVAAFFSEFPLADLKGKYINPNVEDGDQKLFDIAIGGLYKSIQTSNYYEAHLGNMVKFLNTLIDDKYKIRYEEFHQIERSN